MTDPNNRSPEPAGGAGTETGGGAQVAPPASPASPPGGGAPAASGAGSDWRSTLPPDLREDPTIKRYKDVGAMAQGLVELNKTLGRTGVRIPQDGDGPEVQAAFRKALGVPETAADYAIAPPEGFPADKWDKEFEGEFRNVAHELGLPPKAVEKLTAMFAQRQGKAFEAVAAARANTLPNLKKDWGADFEKNNAAADQAIEGFARKAGFTDDDLGMLAAAGMGEKFMRLMANVGLEGVATRGVGTEGRSTSPLTPEQVDKKIEELRATPGFYDKLHADNPRLMQEYNDLLRQRP